MHCDECKTTHARIAAHTHTRTHTVNVHCYYQSVIIGNIAQEGKGKEKQKYIKGFIESIDGNR